MVERLLLALSLLLTGCATVPLARPTATVDPGCNPAQVRAYLQQSNAAIERLNELADRFQQTNSPDEAPPIIKETDALFQEVMLQKAPECADELQINLSLAIVNVSAGMKSIMEGDMVAYQRDMGTYQIAAGKFNLEYQRLTKLVGE